MSNNVPKWIIGGFLLLSLIGFADAVYLTVESYLGEIPPCSIKGCEEVLTSEYATIGPVPTSILGVVYYLFIFIFTIIYIDTKRAEIIRALAKMTAVGFLLSFVFMYLQLFVIGAICIYCIASAGTSTLLFVLGIITLRKTRRYPPMGAGGAV